MRFDIEKTINYFTKLYREVLKRTFTESNRQNLVFILQKIQSDEKLSDYKQISYMLATIMHETAFTLAPIPEKGEKSYFNKYEPSTSLGKRLGNTKKGDGYNFMGRGYVQITGRDNYANMSKYVNYDLVTTPQLALNRNVAYDIISIGMTKGLFTGKKLSDYINKGKKDYREARRVVNGLDKADQIAYYAQCVENILKVTIIDEKSNLPETFKPFVVEEPEVSAVITTKTETTTPETSTVVEVEKTISAPTQYIEPIIPRITSGMRSAKIALAGIFGSTGLGAVWTWVTEKYQSLQEHTNIILIALVIAAMFGIVYLITREITKNKREARAHELTLEQLKIRSNPSLTNVEVKTYSE